MTHPFNTLVFYVDNPEVSGIFYQQLLNKKPLDTAPNFVLFELGAEIRLGLWSKYAVEPKATAPGGSVELGISVTSKQEVDSLYQSWKQQGLTVIQQPTQMDFGYTFTALDPDAHRLRVYTVLDNP